MIVKLLGAGIVILASVFYGNDRIREEGIKLRRIAAFTDMIEYVRDNIDHFAAPLNDIFARYTSDELESIGFLAAVRERGLAAASSEAEREGYMDDGEIKKVFSDFCRRVGGGYKEDELRLCEYTLSQMHKRMNEMRENYTARVKLYRAIPPLFALSLVLILM